MGMCRKENRLVSSPNNWVFSTNMLCWFVNEANFTNISEQNVRRIIFNLLQLYDHYLRYVKVVIQSFPPRRLDEF